MRKSDDRSPPVGRGLFDLSETGVAEPLVDLGHTEGRETKALQVVLRIPLIHRSHSTTPLDGRELSAENPLEIVSDEAALVACDGHSRSRGAGRGHRYALRQ